ncbi:hypothetical protein [Aestuariirhabdus litorea]|uniref:Uncharacterized protein n=1 Tax=Aestuariirhabdus litorea TaxID=2528527 RepID=A0A3P3VK18_9GAMM|nr:hypothetical protein [Aestuariirhabdus litorea]RRJ83072.1 hypothetical protein D0544_14625 [Aestuariirhabdus litorea]RWW93230.1 hypothetical protein DZC74_14600 [Endozoicomonadaceae bacterium GTF-13]
MPADKAGTSGALKVSNTTLDALRRSGLGDETLSLWLHESANSTDQQQEIEPSQPAPLLAFKASTDQALGERWHHYQKQVPEQD